MINESIFEVTRTDYGSFVEQINPESRNIVIEEIGRYHIATKVFSKKTGKCLCSRMSCSNETEPEPEKYYIFEFPDDDERLPPIPKYKLVLEDKEQAQAFFNAVAQLSKENNNG